MTVGALMIVAAIAAATATATVGEFEKVVGQLTKGDKISDAKQYLEAGLQGQPQTVLLIGSDTVGKGETEVGRETARSDSIILVRLDPQRHATALMSLPRDLQVQIPGYGADKINAAYSLGGAKLTLQTVKAATGLPINHVINVDFSGFTDVIDALGCVYVDIDRRYFYDGLEYTGIDLQAGYQRLCGIQALSFARFRHEDTDIVRAARQQDFLRAFKDQLGYKRLFDQRDDLVKIFRDNTSSDITEAEDARNLLQLAIGSATNPIQEIHFEGELGESFVTASSDQMQEATANFLGVKASKGPRGTLTPAQTPNANAVGTTGQPAQGSAPDGGGGGAGSKPDKAAEKKIERIANRSRAKAQAPGEGKAPAEQKQSALEDSTVEGEAQAQLAQAAGVGFPVCYPTLRTTGSVFAETEPHVYKIGVGEVGSTERERFPAYRMVLKRGGVGEYYGIQGTTWRDARNEPHDPPILTEDFTTKTVNGREFEVHYDGDRVRLVAWRTPKGVYWVANTLLQTLSAKEMLKIAGSTRCL